MIDEIIHLKFFCIILLAGIGITAFLYVSETTFLKLFPVVVINTSDYSPHNESQNTTTIVISYFPLTKSKHTIAEYNLWLENLLGFCRSPMVIYTSIEYQPILHRFRRNGTLITRFVVDYESPIEMPPIKELVPTFQQQHLTDPERVIHSVELYAIWCAKTFMLNRSVELNPFRTKYFLYIDAGAFRSPKYRFQWWPYEPNIRSILENDRLLLSMISPLPRRFCCLSLGTLFDGPIRLDLIQGGIIGGSAPAINWWTSVFYGTINSYRSKNYFISKDQEVMNSIALTHPHRINIMLSFRVSCGSIWFAFGPLLANHEERQKLSFSLTCQHQNLSDVIIPLDTICSNHKNIK